MNTPYSAVIIGAGILGLATARELLQRFPGVRLAIVDKEDAPGRHQSGHNSGVLHAGVYYKPGSLKAELCVQGKAAMERFATSTTSRTRPAASSSWRSTRVELGRLADLEARGRANGVPGLRMVGPDEMAEIEPHAAGIRALHVAGHRHHRLRPGGRSADRGARRRRGRLLPRSSRSPDHQQLAWGPVDRGADHLGRDRGPPGHRLRRAALRPGRAAGLRTRGCDRALPRGLLHADAGGRGLCRGLIYPVPDPSLPFLGVHFTRRIDGAVWAGPNAVLATAREGYRRSTSTCGT